MAAKSCQHLICRRNVALKFRNRLTFQVVYPAWADTIFRMKIFIDSGETKDIQEAHDMGLIDGVTTNPTLASKSGKPFKQLIMEITEIVDGPISAEVVSV